MRFLLSLILFMTLAAQAQPPIASPLEKRAGEVAAQFRAAPGDYQALFSPDFLRQVPPAQLDAIFASLFAQVGRSTRVSPGERQGAVAGKFELGFEKGFSIPVTMAVEPEPPHRVSQLLLGATIQSFASFDDIIGQLKALPGQKSFLFARLNGEAVEPIASLDAEEELSIGSAFKLYILAELARSINVGERRWSDVTLLDPGRKSLPSGILQQWPDNSPLTLHTLASLMISQSDNTATDQLLFHLGREKVEAIQRVAGHNAPARNVPFLSTLELFKLKGALGQRFLALDVPARRAFLEATVAPIKRENIVLDQSKPQDINSIEWFASASDLCRAMNYLRLQSGDGQKAQPLREILSINPSFQAGGKWRTVGFKGGSEPGVLNLSFLLQSTQGEWFALALTWNNAQKEVDLERLSALARGALQLGP